MGDPPPRAAEGRAVRDKELYPGRGPRRDADPRREGAGEAEAPGARPSEDESRQGQGQERVGELVELGGPDHARQQEDEEPDHERLPAAGRRTDDEPRDAAQSPYTASVTGTERRISRTIPSVTSSAAPFSDPRTPEEGMILCERTLRAIALTSSGAQ